MTARVLVGALLLLGAVGSRAAAVGDAAWVEQRIRDWQPTPREKAWERIGWARSIREAIRLGGEHRRPVFLFTLDGRMGVGRC
jgi:hypothetical protein